MSPLPYLPKALVDDVDSWGFSETVTGALKGIADAGQDLMRPVTEHVGQAVRQAIPEPLRTLPQPELRLPELPRFDLGRVEDWLGTRPEPTAATPWRSVAPGTGVTEPATSARPAPERGGMFSLPSVASFFPQGGVPRTAASMAQPGTSAQASAAAAAAPQRGGDLRAYARGVAAQHGLDPDVFERQIQQESGFNPKAVSPAGAQGIAQFMPATAKGVGLTDPFEPYSALEAAARHMADNLKNNGGDYARALAAYNAGQGAVNTHGGVPPFAETQEYIRRILPNGQPAAPASPAAAAPAVPSQRQAAQAAPAWGTYTKETLTPNQFTEGQAQGLSASEALAICGPAAAVAFARANGRNPTLREAKELAQNLGLWDVDIGMHGPASQVQLLARLGVTARLQEGTDWGAVAREVSAGRPVIVDTPKHYYTVMDYDPQTGEYEFGASAGVLTKSGGRTRFRPEQLPALGMGAPRATIFMGSAR